ncbi:MAG: hypothetical protein LBH96_01105 [Candidatus Peribacteria bacterium]|jgi:hypothetical protein|nr:hypothetical protein [Candidatus Peribacteria bacterium]
MNKIDNKSTKVKEIDDTCTADRKIHNDHRQKWINGIFDTMKDKKLINEVGSYPLTEEDRKEIEQYRANKRKQKLQALREKYDQNEPITPQEKD